MKTESIINRNESFHTQIEKFALRKGTVYKMFKTYGGLTDFEVAQKMVLPINSITGRRKELLETFFLKAVWSKLNEKTNKMNTVWVVTDPEEREKLVDVKLFELYGEITALEIDVAFINLSNVTEKLILQRIKKLQKLIDKLS